jgi:hypothetical protein
MGDFPIIDVAAGFIHLEPSHVANGFPRTAQGILDRPLKSIRRRAHYLNFFVNMFSHARIISCSDFKTTKNLVDPEGTPGRQICFTKVRYLGQPRVVGKSLAVCMVLAVLICCARGQDQERKLVDRLLKPDMAMQNDAQNKKFTGDNTASINKQARVGSFYIHQQTHS